MAKKTASILNTPKDVNDFHDKKFYTLSAAAYSALEDIQAGEERFNQFLHFAMEGYREFHMNAGKQVKAEEIELKEWKQIDLPCDCVDVNIVGFRCGDLIKVLTYDRNIPKLHDSEDCVKQENKPCPDIYSASTADALIPFYGFYDPGARYIQPKFYGVAVNYNHLGYFDIDWNKRVINFKETIKGQTKVYLEYITDGINYSRETIIHPYAFRLIKLWIHWQRKENDDRVSLSEKARAERLFNNQYDEVLVSQMDMSIDDVKEALRSAYRRTPRH
jgi:hypothetical protein